MTPADLAELLKATAAAVLAEHALDSAALPDVVTVERPRNPEHGDYATNLALQLGKKVGVNPRELAGWLAEALLATDGIAAADVAGPGFVNLRIEASAQNVIVGDVIAAGTAYGHSADLGGKNVNLEFVSANPTGPIHIGGTRWAAVAVAVSVHSLSCHPLMSFGSDEQRQRWLPDMLGGSTIGAYSLSEPQAGSDAAALACKATAVDGGYRVTGSKALPDKRHLLFR